jgi:hypothetical protein
LRRRWEKAASALGIAPPSPTPGTVDSKEDQTNREPGGTSTPKKSMLGLYTSPSKKSPVTPSDANGSARSFKRAAQKIASARRVGERWDILPTIVGRMGRANGTDSGGGGNLLDELMTLPDFVEQAKTDSLANETALTRLQKNAVTDAVRLLRIELGPGFNATKEREIGSAFETALFEHTAAYELGWETKELAWATEVLGLRDENEKLVTEKAATQTALTASTGESKQTIFELNAELASARDVHSELETMHMKHVEQAKELIATMKRETGEEKRLADELKKEEKERKEAKNAEKETPSVSPVKKDSAVPVSPSHLFQRAAQVSVLEDEVERLTQKLLLEVSSSKQIAQRAKDLEDEVERVTWTSQTLSREASSLKQSLRTARDETAVVVSGLATTQTTIESELAVLVEQRTKTLEDEHAIAVATLTNERDAARENASSEAASATRTAQDELRTVLKQRDAFKEEIGSFESSHKELLEKLEDAGKEKQTLQETINQHRRDTAKLEGEHAARLNDAVKNVLSASAELKRGETEVAARNAALAAAERANVETAKRAALELSRLNAELAELKTALGDSKRTTKEWEAKCATSRTEVETKKALDDSRRKSKEWEAKCAASRKDLETLKASVKKARDETKLTAAKAEKENSKKVTDLQKTVTSLKKELVTLTGTVTGKIAEIGELMGRCVTAEEGLVTARGVHSELETMHVEEAKEVLATVKREAAEAKSAALSALTASTDESNRTIFELNAELASARDLHSEFEVMHMQHVEETKEVLATVKREAAEAKSAALSALTASTDESNRTIFELNAELASARDLHSEFEVMHMQHVEETKEVLATVKREAAEAKSAALSALTASTDESNRTIFELNAELASVTQKLKSKQPLIDTALERACVAEASVLERGVELKNAIAAAEAAKTETHEKSALVEKLNLQNKGVGEKLVTKTDELSRLRLELALALRDASQKVHPSLLDELEMKVGRVMLAKDEAEQRTRFAESRFEKLQTEMDERWSDALVTAEAEKQVHQNALDKALARYESLRDVEFELVEWRRRCVEAESALEATLSEAALDVSVAVATVETQFSTQIGEMETTLRDTQRDLTNANETSQGLREEVRSGKCETRLARDEAKSLKTQNSDERIRREAAAAKNAAALATSAKKLAEADTSVAGLAKRLADAETALEKSMIKESGLQERLEAQTGATKEAQVARDVAKRETRRIKDETNEARIDAHNFSMNSETTNAELENELFDVRRDARESQVAMASSLDALREKLAELTRRLEVSDAKALAAERALQESDCANSETSKLLAEAEAKCLTESAIAATSLADADRAKRQLTDAIHEKDLLEQSSSAQLAHANEQIEHGRFCLEEARGKLARISKGGDSARDETSVHKGNLFAGFDEIDEFAPSRESSSSDFGKSPSRRKSIGSSSSWNFGAKDSRNAGGARSSTQSLPPRSPRRSSSTGAEKDLLCAASPSSPAALELSFAVASAIAAAAITSVNSRKSPKKSPSKNNHLQMNQPQWSSPSKEYVKSRSGVDAFASLFAKGTYFILYFPNPASLFAHARLTLFWQNCKAKPDAVVVAVADAAGEIKCLREFLAVRDKEVQRTKREASDARDASRVAAMEATREADRRHALETKRLRDALSETDVKLVQTRAELRASTACVAKADNAVLRLKRSQETAVETQRVLLTKESASHARLAATRAVAAEADRTREVSDAKRLVDRAVTEQRRLQDALVQNRVSLDDSEEERFELRRALEAHVGALVEAKVDEAERVGEIAALRETVDDMRERYKQAARKVLALETEAQKRVGDEQLEQLIGGPSYSSRAATPRLSIGAGSGFGGSTVGRINTGGGYSYGAVSTPRSPSSARHARGQSRSPLSPPRSRGGIGDDRLTAHTGLGGIARQAAARLESDPGLVRANRPFMEKIDLD